MASSKYTLRSKTSSVRTQVFENELLLELVLQNFGPGEFSLTEEDLVNFRLVSHKWKRAATKCLKKLNLETRKFLKLPGEKSLEYIRTFAPICAPCTQKIFTCYNLEYKYPYIEYLTEDLLEAFFAVLVQEITAMSMTVVLKPNIMTMLDNHLSTQYKSLKELKLYIPRDAKQGHGHDDAESFRFPDDENYSPTVDYKLLNLRHLCLTMQLDHIHPAEVTHQHNILEFMLKKIPEGNRKDLKLYLQQWEGIGKSIPHLKKFNQIKNVKVLDLKIVRLGEMKVLSDLGPQLRPRFLVIDYASQPVAQRPILAQEVYEYLCRRGNHLEMLDWGSYVFKFPTVMAGLKKLRIRWGNGEDMLQEAMEWLDQQLAGNNLPAVHPQIVYEQMFPTLEELEFHSTNLVLRTTGIFTSRFLQPQLPCTTLRKLVIGFCKINVLREISTIFPHIKSLKISHDKKEMSNSVDELKYFRDLWRDENFSANLEELSIETCFATQGNRDQFEWDSIFSGVKQGKIGLVSNSTTMTFKDFTHSESELRSSILNLKNLKKLSISNTFRYGLQNCDCHFTNFSAFCVFGRIEKLEFLHIEKGIRKFSKPALGYLRNKLKKVNTVPMSYIPTVEDRIEEVFHTGFTYVETNATKPVNMLDSDFTDGDNNFVNEEESVGFEIGR